MSTLLASLNPSRWFTGLWRNPDFVKLWGSLTIVHFGGQITFLALPLTAAIVLNASPFEVGVLTALEALPYPLFGLFAGVLVDRTRKLPGHHRVRRRARPGARPRSRVRVVRRAHDARAVRGGLHGGTLHRDRLARLPGLHDRARGPREPGRGQRQDRRGRFRRAAHRAGPRGCADPVAHGAVRDPAGRVLLRVLGVDAARHPAGRDRRAEDGGALDPLGDRARRFASCGATARCARSSGRSASGRCSGTRSSRSSCSSARASSASRRATSACSSWSRAWDRSPRPA